MQRRKSYISPDRLPVMGATSNDGISWANMKTNNFKTPPRYDAEEALAARLYAFIVLLSVGSFAAGALFTYLALR